MVKFTALHLDKSPGYKPALPCNAMRTEITAVKILVYENSYRREIYELILKRKRSRTPVGSFPFEQTGAFLNF